MAKSKKNEPISVEDMVAEIGLLEKQGRFAELKMICRKILELPAASEYHQYAQTMLGIADEDKKRVAADDLNTPKHNGESAGRFARSVLVFSVIVVFMRGGPSNFLSMVVANPAYAAGNVIAVLAMAGLWTWSSRKKS